VSSLLWLNNVPFASRLRFSSEVHSLFAIQMLFAMTVIFFYRIFYEVYYSVFIVYHPSKPATSWGWAENEPGTRRRYITSCRRPSVVVCTPSFAGRRRTQHAGRGQAGRLCRAPPTIRTEPAASQHVMTRVYCSLPPYLK